MLPVRDDVLAKAVKELKRALRSEWTSRAVGGEEFRAEFWKEFKQSISSEEQSLIRQNESLGEDQLLSACSEWEAWLASEDAGPGDPRSESLGRLVEQGVPALPLARAVQNALGAARMSRLKWDGRVSSTKAQLKMLTEELESKTQQATALDETTVDLARAKGQVASLTRALESVRSEYEGRAKDLDAAKNASLSAESALEQLRAEQAAHEQGSKKLDDQLLEQTREMGRLHGKITVLTNQVSQAMTVEQQLRETILEKEEGLLKEKRRHEESGQVVSTHKRTIDELQEKVLDLERKLKDRDEKEREREQQKCQCNAM